MEHILQKGETLSQLRRRVYCWTWQDDIEAVKLRAERNWRSIDERPVRAWPWKTPMSSSGTSMYF